MTTESVENLPIANRNFAGFATLVPGAIAQSGTAIAGGVFRLGGGGQNNIMMDGVSTMDTGNNGQLISMNVDSIAEVKVLTQGYQAEFGRSSGLQISAVTKSGTNQSAVPSTTSSATRTGIRTAGRTLRTATRSRSRSSTTGATRSADRLGNGRRQPAVLLQPRYRPREIGGDIDRFRVPTVLERQGDSTDPRQQRRVSKHRERGGQLASGLEILGPPQLTSVWPYEADIPSSTQWNAGVQMTLPWASTVDVSYVGQHGFSQLREIRGQTQVDINAVDFGAAFLPQNQDPTLAASSTPGATAYSTDLLRPYRGLGQVGFNFPDFHETYHSIQASLNRRFRDGIAFGLAYTLGLAWEGNIGLLQRLQHNADGTYVIRADQAEYEELNKDMGNRRHLLKANFLWDLPNLPATSQTTRA